jgi:hypothetical protein
MKGRGHRLYLQFRLIRWLNGRLACHPYQSCRGGIFRLRYGVESPAISKCEMAGCSIVSRRLSIEALDDRTVDRET